MQALRPRLSAKALDTINKGEGGFLDRDLYVFCFNSGDGNIVATGSSNPASRRVIGQRGLFLFRHPSQ
jgi:hypothetical protein